MPAQRIPWFKLWPEAVDHEKIAQLSDGEFRTWVTLLARASQQPTRWRFASVKHAATTCGRPQPQVKALIGQRLLDDMGDEGLWIHDWKQWQERYASDLEHSVNGAANAPPTLREDSANGSPNGAASLPRASAKTGEGRVKNGELRTETGDVPPAPSERPPTRNGKSLKTRRPISPETIERLVSEYGPLFGDEQVVRDWITRALNHTARLKALDEALYVEGTWLKPELEKLRARGGQTVAVVDAPVRATEPHEQRVTGPAKVCERCARPHREPGRLCTKCAREESPT